MTRRRWTIRRAYKGWGLVTGPEVDEPVEVMPVPDEAARKRMCQAITRTWSEPVWVIEEAVLAALEDR